MLKILVIADIALMRFKTEDENDAWQKVTETQTTLSQQGSTVLSWSRNIIYYVRAVVENN